MENGIMKICYLAEINNVHSQRWIKYFAGSGHEILVLSDSLPEKTIPCVKIVRPEMNLLTKILAFKIHPKPYGYYSFKWIPYRKEVAQFNPDIVHAMEALSNGLTLALCGNYPKILTPWGNDIFHDPFQSRIAHFLVKSGLKAASVVSTNHPTLGDYLDRTFNIPKEKVQCFSWGIDLKIFHPHKQREAGEMRKYLKIPEQAPVVMSNRSLSEYWGTREIISAIPPVIKEVPDAHFIIIRGSGKERFYQEMVSYVESHGAGKNVRFINEIISPEKMSALLNLSDIFISVPYTDLLSISVLEGLACGAIPVVSNIEAYKSRIQEGKNGFYVPIKNPAAIAEKVIYILNNLTMRNKIREKNWDIIQKNDDWEKCRPQMVSVYEKALELYKKTRKG